MSPVILKTAARAPRKQPGYVNDDMQETDSTIEPKWTLFIPPFLAVCAILAVVFTQWGTDTVRRDFTAFYASAKMVVECPQQLHDLNAQLKYQTSLGLGPSFLPFPYPAVVPALFVPFTWVSLAKAYWLWLAVNVGLLFFSLALAVRRYALKPEETRVLLLVASTAFPVFTNLLAGQFAFVPMLLLLLFFSDWTKSNEGRAGIWAGSLVVKPSLLAVPLLILILNRNKKALLAAGGTAAGIATLSGVLVGWQGLSDHLALLVDMGRHPAALANLPFMHNLRALSHWFHLGDAGTLVLSAFVALALWSVGRIERSRPPFMIAALIATALVSPHLHTYDLPILLPLFAFGVPTGIWYQRAYVLGPLAILLFSYRFNGVPVIALVLLTLFVLSILKARGKWGQSTISP